MGKRISAIVLTHNNRDSIAHTLQSLAWADEVVVVDDHSTDDTLGIAVKYASRIYKKSLEGNFAKQRNYALSLVKTEWAFFVDSDEEVTKKLAEEILTRLDDTRYSGYRIPRVDIWQKKKLRFGEFLNFSILRLGRVKSGEWKGDVHEIWKISGNVGKLSNPLLHYSGGIGKFLEKLNYYSSLRAKQLYIEKYKSDFFKISILPLGKFLTNYIFRLGFLDGTAGIVNAIGMSFYTFLVRSKLWLFWHEKKK